MYPTHLHLPAEGLTWNGLAVHQWRRAALTAQPRAAVEPSRHVRLRTHATALVDRPSSEAEETQDDWIYKLRREARSHQKKGEFEQAKRMLRDGLIAAPGSCSLLTSLANVLGREGKADEARLVYNQAAAADPTSSVPILV